MDINNLKKKFEELIKQKNISSLVLVLLVVVMIYLVVSYFSSVNNISNSVEANAEVNNTQFSPNSSDTVKMSEYEEKQEASLREILKQINGVGEVSVKINFESSEVKVPAIDKSSQKSVTEETDGEGGKRVNNQETDGDKVVMTSNQGGNEPLILKTDKPKVIGVMVVAEGADNSKINYEITKAVSSLYDVSMDKVNVLAMKK